MTEADWLTCTDPKRMVTFLGDRISERKLRLFAAACCRRVWGQLPNEKSHNGIEAWEKFTDGIGTRQEYDAMSVEIKTPFPGIFYAQARPGELPFVTVGSLVDPNTIVCILESMKIFTEILSEFRGVIVEVLGKNEEVIDFAQPLFRVVPIESPVDNEKEQPPQSALIRDIFGNPFHPVSLDPAWQTSSVVGLARGAYDERSLRAGTLDHDRMAILADALEDAGCADADILAHCRAPGEHVRGCWCVDLILAKS